MLYTIKAVQELMYLFRFVHRTYKSLAATEGWQSGRMRRS